jgi:adenosylcobinamide kinase / adenosylcobinamide-phosphate guanylyltransferase
MGAPLVLVLGGTRSGKSTYGAARITTLAGERPVAYLATAITDGFGNDPELDERIARHRRLRPPSWTTIDVGIDLPRAVATAGTDAPALLLDGLTLWLSALAAHDVAGDGSRRALPYDIDDVLDGPIAAGLAALDGHRGPVVVVTDEIGLGMVPMDPVARAFRDLQGIVHQRLASLADEVVLVVAGLPLVLKAPAS